MQSLIESFRATDACRALLADLLAGRSCTAEGLPSSAVALALAALADSAPSCTLVMVPHIMEAEELVEDINFFRNQRASLLPAWEIIPAEDEVAGGEAFAQRLALVRTLFLEAGKSGPRKQAGRVIVAPVEAVLQCVTPPAAIRENTLRVAAGDTVSPETIQKWLSARRFTRSPQVEMPGEFSVRGGILDVFPFASDAPYRLEFFGDRVESIRLFNVDSQTSQVRLTECQILGLSGTESHGHMLTAGHTSILSYLPAQAWIAMLEPPQIQERAERIAGSLSEDGTAQRSLCDFADILKQAACLTQVVFTRLPSGGPLPPHRFDADACSGFGLDMASLVRDLERLVQCNRRTIVVCHNPAEQQRLRELLQGTALAANPKLEGVIGQLNHAFELRDIEAALIPYHEMFHRYRERRRIKRFRPARPIESFVELEKGDYVVHLTHGIARFLGMQMLEREGRWRDHLVLEFEEGAKLYVPASKVELVQKYVGGTDRPPALSRLGTQAWAERKKRVEQACLDLATQMLELQAVRAASPGIAFPADDEWQKKFEAAFIYPETEDQLQVASEIKTDMESPKPMDRLICGDVGFGKTELAMRAAFKAVMAGKQVAVLVPTTVLALQHYRTFSERMADYPIRVESLSRFRTSKEQAETLERLREGATDIVIGTHRLIQPDVAFKDLGLVIIDEEQRFGVEHKERLKRLRATVDVLTLTATPIPRTLHMSLLGLRDVSSLTTPPQDRLAIQTRLCRFDPNTIRQAVLRELGREGQVFFVHNRVLDIESVAETLHRIVPEARVGIAHGQMPERLLERQMLDFVEHKIDVLLCTTIIESGLDIPNANTIIINNADHFGLAEMHQLRGRVGRYRSRAYAYLVVPNDRPVTPDAEKRLRAIEQYSDLGSGFKIALRDLEIRGAGNILGPEQHGHITAVGYEMYYRLLNIAVKRMKGERVPPEFETSINMNLEAFFPENYVSDPRQKVEMYRKLSRCGDESEIRHTVDALTDRFGPLPPQARNVVAENRLRLIAEAACIKSLTASEGSITAHVQNAEGLVGAAGRAGKGWLKAIDRQTVRIRLPRPNLTGDETADFLKKVLQLKVQAGTITPHQPQ